VSCFHWVKWWIVANSVVQGCYYRRKLWTIHSERVDYFQMDTQIHILHQELVVVASGCIFPMVHMAWLHKMINMQVCDIYSNIEYIYNVSVYATTYILNTHACMYLRLTQCYIVVLYSGNTFMVLKQHWLNFILAGKISQHFYLLILTYM